MKSRYLFVTITLASILTHGMCTAKSTDSENAQSSDKINSLPTTQNAIKSANPSSATVGNSQTDRNDAEQLNIEAVETIIIEKTATYQSPQLAVARTLTATEIPSPKKLNKPKKYKYVGMDGLDINTNESLNGNEIRSLQSTITAGGTVTNINNTGGSLFIPADPHGAAGPNHVVNVFNVSIEFYQKDGTQDFSDDLQAFFSALTPANFTFDPKVVYDQHENRWVVVTLERTDTDSGDPSNTSLVLVAVSDDSDPNGSWTVTEINTSINIGGQDHWLDYPGLAVDEEAIYITGNMFQYFGGTANPGAFGGNRLIIVDKGLSGGFYDGGTASASIFDQTGSVGGFTVTQMPAQIYGNPGGSIGTWLVGYSGLSNGVQEALQLIRVDNPTSVSPTFVQQLPFIGDVDNTAGGAIPTAPQSGGATAIASGDRRVLDAVWRDDSLYFTTEVLPGSGADAGEATAYWGELSTSGAPAFTQGNTIGGDADIGTDTYTSYASIAVNDDGGIVVGFSASSSSIFPSSYYVNRSPSDALNTMRPATLIRAGEASYVRTFGGPDNRWGDYSATAVDPDEECFWVYNKYATTQGNPTSGGEVGRYLTAHAHFCNDSPVANNDTATVTQGGTVSTVNGAITSLIANDSDVDTPDDTLTMNTSAVSGPSNGLLSLSSNGTFSYTHDNSAATSDSFVYRVCDDGSPSKCDDGTVNITVTGINATPVAVDDAITVTEGGTATSLDGGSGTVLNNDTDADDVNLTAAVNDDVDNGSLTLNSDGTFSYQHNGGETTTDSFTYDVCDDESPTPACDTATVNITITPVNDAPNGNNDAITLAEGGTATSLDGGSGTVLNNDTDADDVNLTAAVSDDVDNGSLTLNSNGTFSYQHDGGETTTDSFTYDVCDDNTPTPACDTATVNITITPVNDAPNGNNDAITVAEGGTATSLDGGSGTVLNNDTDVDDVNLTVSTNVGVAHGSLSLVSDGTFIYQHDGSETTTDSFIYDVCDDEAPVAACDSVTVNITINPVNDAPIASDDAIQVLFNGIATELVSGSTTVLNNDTDVDDVNLTATVLDDVDHGTLTLNSDGTFSYQHGGGADDTDSFTYEACDDETPTNACNFATVSISIGENLDIIFKNGFE